MYKIITILNISSLREGTSLQGGGEAGIVQPSQQHVVPCVKGVEWGLGTRGLRIVAAFWASILVSSA